MNKDLRGILVFIFGIFLVLNIYSITKLYIISKNHEKIHMIDNIDSEESEDDESYHGEEIM